VTRVTSTRNPRVRAAADLARRRIRDETGLYLVEGPRAILDLLPTGAVEELFAVPPVDDAVAAAADEAVVRITPVTAAVLERIAASTTPQHVVAVARQRHAELDQVLGTGFAVVLVAIADPGNAGTIVRTATAAGARGVVLTEGSVDPWNPKAVRASAGTVGRLPIVTGVSYETVVEALRGTRQRLVALDPTAETSIGTPGVLSPPVALVFGNETHGLPSEQLQAADAVVSIPLYGEVESLNLAASVAVAAYAAAAAVEEAG
jgi:RNA methyltransferase, TrmH family